LEGLAGIGTINKSIESAVPPAKTAGEQFRKTGSSYDYGQEESEEEKERKRKKMGAAQGAAAGAKVGMMYK
jgi:hypothetical protein